MDELDKKYMSQAIDLAARCVQADPRLHPKVGCVIVTPGGQIVTGYRGEHDPREHAEYTALERNGQGIDLTGATAYVTLEPCTKRGPGKIECAKRLIDRGIRRVVIGVMDENITIRGDSIGMFVEAGIELGFADPPFRRRIQDLNREFLTHYRGIAEQLVDLKAIAKSLDRLKDAVESPQTADKRVIDAYLDARTPPPNPDEAATRSRLLNEYGQDVLLNFYGNAADTDFRTYSVDVGGRAFQLPVVTKEDWTGLCIPLWERENKPVSCRLHIDDDYPAALRKYGVLDTDPDVRHNAEVMSWVVHDSPLYRLRGVEIDQTAGPLSLSFSTAAFTSNRLHGSGLLSDELMAELRKESAISGHETVDVNRVAANLRHRKNLLPDLASFGDLNNRICVGGVSAVVVEELGDGKFDAYYSIRAPQISDNPERCQTLPRGFHEPLHEAFLHEEVDIRSTIAREMLEELFGGDKLLRHQTDDPMARSLVAALWGRMLKDTRAYVTGICFGMEMGNYEISVLLLIDRAFRESVAPIAEELRKLNGDPSYAGIFQPCWESESKDKSSGIKALSLRGRDFIEMVFPSEDAKAPLKWVPGSVFTLLESVRRLPLLCPGYTLPSELA